MVIATTAWWIPLVPEPGRMVIIECWSTLHIGMMSRPMLALFIFPVGMNRISFVVPLWFISLLQKFVLKVIIWVHSVMLPILSTLVLWWPLGLIASDAVRKRWLSTLIQSLHIAMTVLVDALNRLSYVWWVGTRGALMILSAATVLNRFWLLYILVFFWRFVILLPLLRWILDWGLNHLLSTPALPLVIAGPQLLRGLCISLEILLQRFQLSSWWETCLSARSHLSQHYPLPCPFIPPTSWLMTCSRLSGTQKRVDLFSSV